MPSQRFSIPFDAAIVERLETEAREERLSVSQLVRRLVEEGLRMEAHRGIVFKPGPMGRRPALIDGPDVWEVIGAFRGVKGSGEEAIKRTAKRMGRDPEPIRIAVRYYAEYPDEIDEWIRRNDGEADRLEAAWRREHGLPEE